MSDVGKQFPSESSGTTGSAEFASLRRGRISEFDSATDTRHRLIDAAGEVFADVGFQAATVRDICQRAGANIAAVNYHFGDKDTLYLAVFDHARECAAEFDREVGATMAAGQTPAQRLHAYVVAFLRKLFATGRPTWHTRLISREMIEPTRALDRIVELSIRPNFELGRRIVREIVGPGPSERQVIMCAASVVGQCLHYHHCRAVTARLYPGWLEQPDFLDTTAAHIATFSLCALTGLAQQPALWLHEASGDMGGGAS